MTEEPRRFDRLCAKLTLGAGFQRVKKNRGQAGIDGVSIEDFAARLDEALSQLQQELVSWTYQPSPVRRVEIPKPGGQGVRLLGIPTVRDRVVQAALQQLLEPLFEPGFSPHRYGFRPGRSQHQAVRAGQAIMTSGKPFVVDIDLSKFFDRIPHDRLIARMSRTVDDQRVLRLVGLMLRSGVMDRGVAVPSVEGTMQGGPLSPLLSNIVLDELDQELERRGLAFCRFADDGNSFVKTPKAAARVMASISRFIEKQLKLQVNREKSQVAPAERVKCLGFTVVKGTIAIAHKALQTAMNKVRELTPRGTQQSLEATLAAVNRWYVGWSNYYSLTAYPAQLQKIEAHIRRRLRARLIHQQQRKLHLYRRLVERGVPRGQAAKAVYANDNRWALSATRAVTKAYPNSWFIQQKGQVIRADQRLAHWLEVSQWISLA